MNFLGKIFSNIQKGLLKSLLVCIRCYQLFLSPVLGSHCRFYPSCSHYGIEALQHHGVVHGTVLTVKRILRCHPASQGGFDPVPEKRS